MKTLAVDFQTFRMIPWAPTWKSLPRQLKREVKKLRHQTQQISRSRAGSSPSNAKGRLKVKKMKRKLRGFGTHRVRIQRRPSNSKKLYFRAVLCTRL
jgi:hypothetical protein